VPRAVRPVLYGLSLVPVAAGFLFAATYGVNVPVSDDWSMVGVIARHASGDLSLSDLFAAHNEHRIFFPRLVTLALAEPTHYDIVAQLFVTQCSLAATAALLFLALRRTAARGALLLLPVVAFLVFSFRQWELMLLGFSGFAFAGAFGVLALLLLTVRGRRLAFAGALGAATVASYSMFQGLPVWPAGLLLLVLTRAGRRAWMIPTWVAAGAAEWLLYFHGLRRPAGHPPLSYSFEHPVAALGYFFTLLGSALFPERWPAFATGIGLLLAAAVAVARTGRRGAREGAAFWLSLMAFSAWMLLSITAGRAGFGVDQALASRYASYSLLGVIGLLALVAKLWLDRGSRTGLGLTVMLTALIAVSGFYAVRDGRTSGQLVRTGRERGAFYLATYRSQPDAHLNEIYPLPVVVRRLAPSLERMGYTVFAGRGLGHLPPRLGDLERAKDRSLCVIDSINGRRPRSTKSREKTVSLAAGTRLIDVNGWCVDAAAGRTAGGAYLILDGKPYPVRYGSRRADVAMYFHTRAYLHGGFSRQLWPLRLTRGTHTISVIAVSNDRRRAWRRYPTIRLKVA